MIPALLAAVAAAQEDTEGFDAHGLKVVAQDGDPRDPIAVERPHDLRQGRWFASALLEYADRPLVWRTVAPDGTVTDDKRLDDVFAVIVSGGGVPIDRLRLDLAAPVFVASTSSGEPQGADPGDLRFSAAVALLDEAADDPLGLGIVGFLDAPTGDAAAFLGQQGPTGGAKAAATVAVGRGTLGADLGAQFNPRLALANLTGADTLVAGAAAGLLVTDTVGVGVEARVSAPFQRSVEPGSATPAEGMLTLRHRSASGAHVTGGFGTAVSGGAGAANWRLLVGGGFGSGEPRPKDLDLDGILDKVDACPEVAEVANAWQDTDGCPDALGTVAISAEFEGRRARGAELAFAGSGDPLTATLGDADWEVTDRMPGSAWTVSARLGACLQGRSEGTATEGRTVAVVMLEPDLPAEVIVEVVDAKGRPIPTATIRWQGAAPGCVVPIEVVVDAEGRYREQVGIGEHTLVVGAADYAVHQETVAVAAGDQKLVRVQLKPTKVRVTGTEIAILEQVFFETAKAIIKPASFPLLDEVADTIETHPEMRKLEVAGHTDDQGADAANLDLSQRRAEAVRAYLVERGVAPDRLVAVGYGETRPIDSNKSSAGRAKNRRVEFKILEREEAADPAP